MGTIVKQLDTTSPEWQALLADVAELETFAKSYPLTGRDARVFLDGVNEPGYSGWCGNFNRAIVGAALLADTGNQRKLALGFPAIVAATVLYQSVKGGYKDLQDLARQQ